jgi:hypothetical protein
MTAGGHIQFNRIAPAQHREQITIGDGEATLAAEGLK